MVYCNPATWLQVLRSTSVLCKQCYKNPAMGHPAIATLTACVSQHPAAKYSVHYATKSTRKPVRFQPSSADPVRPVVSMFLQSLMKRYPNLRLAADTAAKTPKSSILQSPLQKDMSTANVVSAIQLVPRGSSQEEESTDQIKRLLIKQAYTTPLALSLQACHNLYLKEQDMSQYLSTFFSVVDELFDELSPAPAEITQLFLYIFLHGNAPQMLFHKVEGYLLMHLDMFHISDLGIICGGFFRANTRLSSQDLLDGIARKLLEEIKSLEPFLLPNFLKVFRHSSYIRVSFYDELANHLVQTDFLSKFRTINPLMHIAFTYASLSIQHEKLFDQLLKLVNRSLYSERTVRTKDVSKFVWACGTLQFKPANYHEKYQKLIKAFRSGRGGRMYPESLGELLVGLIYLEMFPQDLLSQCLSSDISSVLMDSGGDKEKSMQLLLMQETMKIECPEYTGNHLSLVQVKKLLQHPLVAHDLEAQLKVRVGLAAILSTLQEKLGTDKVHCHYPLPHFNSAVVELQYCREGGFLPFHPMSVKHLAETNINLPEQLPGAKKQLSVTRVGIVASGNHQHALNSHLPLGHWSTKLRQLSKVGYTVCQISPEEASDLEWSTSEERWCHLSRLLSDCLQTVIM